MGMYGHLRRASVADGERLRAEPALVTPFLYGEPLEKPKSTGGLFGWLKRLSPISGVVNDPDVDVRPEAAKGAVWPPASDGEELDLDKAWHGLHFLFTGRADGGPEPACFVLEGGEEVGDDGDGEPIARMLSADQVRRFSAFLSGLSRGELESRFDAARMTELEIYPDVIWERDAREETAEWLLAIWEALRDFMAEAARRGEVVVVAVS